MTTKQVPVFSALEAAYVSSGLTPDQHRLLTPLWAEGEGIQFVDGKALTPCGTLDILWFEGGPITGLSEQYMSNGDRVVWAVAGNKLWRNDGFASDQKATLTDLGVAAAYPDFTHYGNWTFINTGVGAPLFHKPESGLEIVAEVPTDFSKMLKFLSYVVALGVDDAGTGVQWCNSRNIAEWIPTRSNDAGTIYLDQFNSPIVTGISYNQSLLVFSQTQVAVVTFLGAPFYFGQRHLFDGVGCVGKNAITTDGRNVYGVSRDGAWQLGLDGYRYIDEVRIQQYFLDNVNWDQSSKIIVARNSQQRTIEFHFPMRGSSTLNESWSFDPSTGSWSKVQARRFHISRENRLHPLIGTTDGRVQELGASMLPKQDLLLKTKPLLLQGRTQSGITETHLDMLVQEVDLLLHKSKNVQMQIGVNRESDDSFIVTDWIDLQLTKQTYLVPAGVPSGSYWQLTFSGEAAQETVQSSGEAVTVSGEEITSWSQDNAWDLNLQGFLLFGALEGTKGAS